MSLTSCSSSDREGGLVLKSPFLGSIFLNKLFFFFAVFAVAYVALCKCGHGGHCTDAAAAGTAVRRRRGARNGADGQTRDASDVRDILCIVVEQRLQCLRCARCGRQSHLLKSSDGALRPRPTTSVIGRFSASRHLCCLPKPPPRPQQRRPIDAYTIQSTRPPPCRARFLSSASRRSWSSPSTTAPASSPSTTRTRTRQPATRMTTPARSRTRQ